MAKGQVMQRLITERRPRVSAAVPVVLAACLLTACGGGQPAAGSGTPTATASQGSPATPDASPSPAVTESSPPGDISDNTAYVPYQGKSPKYEVKVPEGWARTGLSTGVGFTDKLNSVRVEVVAAASAPTEASAKTADVAKLQAAGGNFALKKVETVTRKGGKAIRIVYLVDSAPNPVTGKVIRDLAERYEFFSKGQEAVLTLSGPTGADNVDPWRIVSDSFRWL
ncbi:MAG: lipoprotein [Sphaerisporangium sp.]|jgi:hypothetical protein|nr:lipoprotein [Sphaerisporangium sp.]